MFKMYIYIPARELQAPTPWRQGMQINIANAANIIIFPSHGSLLMLLKKKLYTLCVQGKVLT